MDNPYLKYQNKDSRCKYPFFANALGYCWGYAGEVDKGLTQEQTIEKLCSKKPKCPFWKEEKK